MNKEIHAKISFKGLFARAFFTPHLFHIAVYIMRCFLCFVSYVRFAHFCTVVLSCSCTRSCFASLCSAQLCYVRALLLISRHCSYRTSPLVSSPLAPCPLTSFMLDTPLHYCVFEEHCDLLLDFSI